VRITQHYWNRYKVQPASKSNRPRPITREREQIRKMENAMDGVGWTALVIAGLLILLVIIVQVGKRFYDW